MNDPQSATTLTELCDILNEWAAAFAYGDTEITDYPGDLTGLPTFGGTDIEDTDGVWSWDAESVLVSGPQITVEVTGWTLESRCPISGEAPLHCRCEACED